MGISFSLAQDEVHPTPQAYGGGIGTEQPPADQPVRQTVKPTPEAYNPDYQLTGAPKQELYQEGKDQKIVGKYKISEAKHVFLDANISPGPVDANQRAIYQVNLSNNRSSQYGIRFSIKWGGEGPVLPNLLLKLELKGIMGDVPTYKNVTYTYSDFRRGGKWTEIQIVGEDYQALGQITAWKTSLICDNQVLAVKRSFLWRE